MPFTTILIIILVLLLNGIFVAYEMALASISRVKLTVLMAQKKKGALEAAFMKDRIEASLAVAQVAVTLMSAIAAATGGVGVAESLAPYLEKTYGFSPAIADILALIFLIIPLSCFTIIFAELIPKMVALNNKEWVCLTLAPPMKILFQITYPIIIVFEKIVKIFTYFLYKIGPLKNYREAQVGLHELAAAVSLARTSRLIGAREEKIVLSAAQLSVRPVREIMLPRSDISMIPIDCTLTEALLRAHLDMHTRFPVCEKEGDSQTIQGYVNFKDIILALKLNPAEPNLRGIIRPIKTIMEDTPISQVLEQMMQEKSHIALVGSKDQRIFGMITLEDIIEELVGEIEDEFDRLPTYIHPYAGGWIMGGGVTMNAVVQTTGVSLPLEETRESTLKLAEWCAKKLKAPLKGGEMIDSNGLQVLVRKLRRRRLGEAIVTISK